jgi:signal transduction histidine kinase
VNGTAFRISHALAFVALNPLLATVALPMVIVGIALSAGFAFTVIGGLFFLLVTFHVARALGAVQRAHLRLATGQAIGDPRPFRRRPGRWSWLTAPMRDPSGWRTFAYWLVEPIVAWITFAVVFAMLSGGVVAVTLPLYAHRLEGVGNDIPVVGLVLGALAGAAAILAGLSAAVVALQLHLALARAMLGPNRTAELEARVSNLGTARSAAIDAAELERRRIERDLHDGTQQRLVSLAMDLGMAKEKFSSDPDAARDLLDEAHREVKATMAELRSLTRGLRPSVLEDRGLDAALSALVARSAVPVDIEVALVHRPPPAVESAAYFVAAEALTNVAKHAAASHAVVRIAYEGDDLVVEVGDDGRGNAHRVAGGGLDGLAERLAGFEGRLQIISPQGGPTLLRAELPCGS